MEGEECGESNLLIIGLIPFNSYKLFKQLSVKN